MKTGVVHSIASSKWLVVRLALLAAAFGLTAAQAVAQADHPIEILTRAHAHNDYEHHRPLFDALDNGLCSVEADIFLIDGQLLVAHTRSEVRPERTLQSLYLDPLRKRIQEQGGRLYRGGPPGILLIDIKTAAEPTYAALREVLKQYADLFTTFQDGKIDAKALTAVITGDRPTQAAVAAEPIRYAELDGQLPDLDSDVPKELVPWISADWAGQFKWRAKGPFPDDERAKLKKMVAKAHAHGRQIRFWDAPDVPVFWEMLLAEDVDLINTDDLAGLQKFFWEKKHLK